MLLIYENKEAVEVEIGCNQCASCKECIKACNYGVLEGVDDTPIVVNPSSCVVYLECEKSCPPWGDKCEIKIVGDAEVTQEK